MKLKVISLLLMVLAGMQARLLADTTIYYDNSVTQWAKVNIHYWGGPDSQWPGKAMTKVADNVWKFTFTGTSLPSGFLFDDTSGSGDANQTSDFSGKPTNGHIYKGAGGNKGKVTDEGVYTGNDDPEPETPVVKANPKSGTHFTESLTITLTVTPEATIYYTLDGSTPTKSSNVYSSPITIYKSTTIKTLAVTAKNKEAVQTFTYSERQLVDYTPGTNLNTNYYKVNPNGGYGSHRTVNAKFTKLNNDNRMCVADNALQNWTESDLICQGVARDISSAFRGKHEYPVIDTYSVYAAYDANNLYLGIQYVYSTWDIYGDGKADNLRAKPYQMDGRIMLAFDLDPEKSFEGVLENGNTIWDADGQYNKFANGTDCIWLGSTKSTSGTPGLFFPTPEGKASYASPYCLSIDAPFYGCADGLLPSITEIWAQEQFEYDPEDLKTNDGFVNIINEVPTSQHTFYEFKFPLAKLGITEDHITNKGIGVMVIDTYGQGATGCTPYDPTVFDNAKKPYSKDASSSAEKEDLDLFTSPHARIGHAPGSSVETLDMSGDTDTTPRYFNLQGVETQNPATGIYIVKRGNKTTKEYIRR